MQDSQTVTEVLPEKKRLPLQGLYLREGLAQLAARAGRVLVITAYVTDRNGVVAKADEHHQFGIPPAIANDSDWRLFQELMAQADVIISTAAYLRRASAPGSHAQDILHQFEPGREFAELGDWRLRAGYSKRSPDLAIVARSLDFKLPEDVARGGRRITVFTTHAMAGSEEARAITASGAAVIGSGEAGVDGSRMIDYLSNGTGYRVIMMASGPSVLHILLQAKRLDLLHVTQVQVEIPFEDPSTVRTILPEGKKVDDPREFHLTHKYLQEDVKTANGSVVSQFFLRYDKQGVPSGENPKESGS